MDDDDAAAEPESAEDPRRVATLRSLTMLDTPVDERFDRLTRLACRLFDVPVAAVSLVDANRVWFKSCAGAERVSIPCDLSFCAHFIDAGDVLLIPDATQDPRFANNPLVLNDPHYRFYVGCPLRMADGTVLGALCLLDTQPRTFNADDLVSLQDLAAMAAHELTALSMAITDELTGVHNRRGLRTLGQQALAMCDRAGQSVTLLMFDLDDFKQINDVFGHAEGDLALQAFAAVLKSVFRSSDVVSRFGGDEFLVLLTNVHSDRLSSALARFYQGLEALNHRPQAKYEISCSIGTLGVDPAQRKPLDALLAEADALMYAAKAARRSSVS